MAPVDAEACSPVRCEPGAVAPADGTSIPSNAPSLIFVRPYDNAQGGASDGGFTLATAAGAEVAFTTTTIDQRALLVTPSALEADAGYVLSYTETCMNYDTSAPQQVDVAFSTTPPSPFPTSAGALHVSVARDPKLFVGTASGSCVSEVDASVATLAITPSEALRPFLPITRWGVEVDGVRWSASRWGGLTASGGLQGLEGASIQGANSVHGVCSSQDQYAHQGVSIGAHQVKVIAEIAGVGTLPALEADFTLDCSLHPHGDDGIEVEGPSFPWGCGASGASSFLGLLLLVPLRRFFARG